MHTGGQRILVQTAKSQTSLAIFVASIKLGNIYIPLNINYTSYELEYFINDSKPSLIIIEEKRKEELSQLAHQQFALLKLLLYLDFK